MSYYCGNMLIPYVHSRRLTTAQGSVSFPVTRSVHPFQSCTANVNLAHIERPPAGQPITLQRETCPVSD